MSNSMTDISNCVFNGVKWDGDATRGLLALCEAAKANAEAIARIADVFQSQHVNIDAMVKVEGDTSDE